MKKIPRILVIVCIVTIVSLIFNVVLWAKYRDTSSALDLRKAQHQHACKVITSLDNKIDSLNNKAYGTSLNLDRGTVNEHLAYCYE